MPRSKCPECGSFPLDAATSDVSATPGTRLHTLLSTNEPPDEADLSLIQSALSQADARLAALNEGMSRLQDRLKQLEEERASVSSYRLRIRNILSPLRRIPPEILGEIFFQSLSFSTGYSLNVQASPWVLTYVSRRWRAVSLPTPSLWSRVTIRSHRRARDPLSLAETQIQRAQNLKIHFYASESRPQVQMFQLLSRYGERWTELNLRITAEMLPLLRALRDRIPRLERIWMNWMSESQARDLQSIEAFQTAPSLTHLGLYNKCLAGPISLPFHQLTHYELDAPWEMHKAICPHDNGFRNGSWELHGHRRLSSSSVAVSVGFHSL
ncbi:hypothetical protein C8R47DRAFT_1164374 [Mycena vitilis]|nr:hypothetical protein C8R47DRAFT_1164374 [Mycena vitilis]